MGGGGGGVELAKLPPPPLGTPMLFSHQMLLCDSWSKKFSFRLGYHVTTLTFTWFSSGSLFIYVLLDDIVSNAIYTVHNRLMTGYWIETDIQQ